MSNYTLQNLKSYSESADLQQKYDLHIARRFKELFGGIPPMKLEKDWEIGLQSAWNGVIVRFSIENTKTNRSVSVYLDAFDQAGSLQKDKPYWEIYSFQPRRDSACETCGHIDDYHPCERLPFNEENNDELLNYIANEIN